MKQYRGLTKDGKWVYGWYVQSQRAHNIIPTGVSEWYGGGVGKYFYGATEVIPETVGQQLPFDAQNGDKIYEGDIAKHSCGKLFVIEPTKVGWNPFDEHCVKPHRIECIIGNIHQHPKLLEQDNA